MREPWEITPEMVLTEKEVASLLSNLRGRASSSAEETRSGVAAVVDQVIIHALLFSGLRCSEFCKLRLADVTLPPASPAFIVRGKGDPRNVWLPESLGLLLARYARRVRPALLSEESLALGTNGPFIVNERGRAYDRTALYRRVVSILTGAGFGPRASVQLLRHTYGYLAYKRTGGNLLFVQRQLGHAHPMITAVYANLVDESYPILANGVDAVGGSAVSGRARRQVAVCAPARKTRSQL